MDKCTVTIMIWKPLLIEPQGIWPTITQLKSINALQNHIITIIISPPPPYPQALNTQTP